jgi:hypothetical protein
VFTQRSLHPQKLEEQGKAPITIRGKAKISNKFSWFDSVDATIKLVGWAKRQKRIVRRESRKFTTSVATSSRRDRAQLDAWDDGSSDDCYSLSADSDDEGRKPKPHLQIAQVGELRQEYDKRMEQARKEDLERQKMDYEFAKNLPDLVPVEVLEAKEKIEKEDYELAKKLQEEADFDAKRGSDGKRKAETQNLNFFFKQQKNEIAETAVSPQSGDALTLKEAALIDMGFDIKAARKSLRDAAGDVDLAVRMLLSENDV